MDIVVRRAGVKRLKTQASFPPHTRSLISFHSRSQHSPRAVGRSITRDERRRRRQRPRRTIVLSSALTHLISAEATTSTALE